MIHSTTRRLKGLATVTAMLAAAAALGASPALADQQGTYGGVAGGYTLCYPGSIQLTLSLYSPYATTTGAEDWMAYQVWIYRDGTWIHSNWTTDYDETWHPAVTYGAPSGSEYVYVFYAWWTPAGWDIKGEYLVNGASGLGGDLVCQT